MTYTIGIDLGTTYSAAAVHANGVTEMVSLGHRATIVPSAVFVGETGDVLVGEAALRRGATEPERLCREFKRRIGDSVPLIVGGSPFSAEALTARLLRWIVGTVTEQRGEQPRRIVLTYPANWGAFKQERLAQAIRIAELAEVVGGDADHVSTITEPEAAAISYASTERVPVDEVIAVYDLGGGTFDAAVLRKTDEGFEMLGSPEGIERLGGIDVDEAIFSHVRRALGDALDKLDSDESGVARAVGRLRSDCVEAKEALSSDTQVSIPVLLPNLHTEVRLTRGELEGMVRPVLEDTVGALRRAIASTGLTPDKVDRVLLVGGSSRIPLVAQLVAEALGRPFFVDTHPKHAVALGAALSGVGGSAMTPPHGVPVVTAPSPEQVMAPAAVPEPPERPPSPDPARAPIAAAGTAVLAPPDPPHPGPTVRSRSSGRQPVGGSGGRRALAVAAAVAVVAVGGYLFVQAGGGDGNEDPTDQDDATTTTPTTAAGPPELTVGQVTPLAEGSDGVAVEGDNLWVATTQGQLVHRLDLATGDVEESFPLDGDPLAVAVADGSIWVTRRNLAQVVRLDPASGEITDTIETGSQPAVFSFGAGAMWLGSPAALVRIDPATNEVEPVLVDQGSVGGVFATDDTVWVSLGDAEAVAAIDPVSFEERGRIPVGTGPDPVIVTPGGVWVGNRGENTLMRINPDTLAVEQTVQVNGAPTGLAATDDGLYAVLSNSADAPGRLVLLDPATGEVLRDIEVGLHPLGVTTSEGRVWITLARNGSVARVDVG